MVISSGGNIPIEAKLMKKKALKDSPAIEVGETIIGHYFHKPEIGKSFYFFNTKISIQKAFWHARTGIVPFQTTLVTKIIDEFTFETKNSVYYLIDKSRERDIKIEDILK